MIELLSALLAFFIVLSIHLWREGSLMGPGFREEHPDVFKDVPPLKRWQIIFWSIQRYIPIKGKDDE